MLTPVWVNNFRDINPVIFSDWERFEIDVIYYDKPFLFLLGTYEKGVWKFSNVMIKIISVEGASNLEEVLSGWDGFCFNGDEVFRRKWEKYEIYPTVWTLILRRGELEEIKGTNFEELGRSK